MPVESRYLLYLLEKSAKKIDFTFNSNLQIAR